MNFDVVRVRVLKTPPAMSTTRWVCAARSVGVTTTHQGPSENHLN